jgi:myotubularin-related protein 1/2
MIKRKLIKLEEDLPLLSNEEVLAYQGDVRYLGVGQYPQDGCLVITNARLLFARQRSGYLDFTVRIYLGSVARILEKEKEQSIDLFCKDLRSVRFCFLHSNGVEQRRAILEAINRAAFPDFREVFAFYYQPQRPAGAAPISPPFTFNHEFERLNISPALWKVSNANREYAHCSSYPEQFIVPARMDERLVVDAFSFRSKGRIPILTYYHPNTATITRCSQPKVGVTNARSEADEMMTTAIREANMTNSQTLYLFDARPKANAIANQALGMGYEKVSESGGRYQNCKLEFLNIENIHVMRDAFNRVQRLCESTHKDDKNFYSLLDSTLWLSHVKLVLASSVKIAKIIDRQGCSVLLHCSDGWDRTAQLAALAQIFLNPFYRTLQGFRILVEKDWLAVGHKFGVRCGHADSNFASDQRSPIFLQFIDCVWQCMNQFPCLFEYNEKYLIHLMDHVYSCQYGTFLMNNERERVQANLNEITVSVWDDIQQQSEQFLNPLYLPGLGVVYPSTSYEDLAFWKAYYLRHSRTPNPYHSITAEMRALQLVATIESLQSQLNALKEAATSSSQ